MTVKRGWLNDCYQSVCIWLLTNAECDTRPFYCGTAHESRFVRGWCKNSLTQSTFLKWRDDAQQPSVQQISNHSARMPDGSPEDNKKKTTAISGLFCFFCYFLKESVKLQRKQNFRLLIIIIINIGQKCVFWSHDQIWVISVWVLFFAKSGVSICEFTVLYLDFMKGLVKVKFSLVEGKFGNRFFLSERYFWTFWQYYS